MGILDRFLKRQEPNYAEMSPQQVGAAVGPHISEARFIVASASAEARSAERRVTQAKDDPQISPQRLALAVADWRLRRIKAEICRAVWFELTEQAEHLKLIARADRDTVSQHVQRPTLFGLTPTELFKRAQRSALSAITSGSFTAIEKDLGELGIAGERIETLRELFLSAIPPEAGSARATLKVEDVPQELSSIVKVEANPPGIQSAAVSHLPVPSALQNERLGNTSGRTGNLWKFLKRLWGDAVWSKVIATGLVAAITAGASWCFLHFRTPTQMRIARSEQARLDRDAGIAGLSVHSEASMEHVTVSHLDGVVVNAGANNGGITNNNFTINNQPAKSDGATKAATPGRISLLRQAQSHWYDFVTEIKPELAYYHRTSHRFPDPDAAREAAEMEQHYGTARGILYKVKHEERDARMVQLGEKILSSFGGLIHRSGDQNESLESTEAGLESLEKRLDERSRLTLSTPGSLHATGAGPAAVNAHP